MVPVHWPARKHPNQLQLIALFPTRIRQSRIIGGFRAISLKLCNARGGSATGKYLVAGPTSGRYTLFGIFACGPPEGCRLFVLLILNQLSILDSELKLVHLLLRTNEPPNGSVLRQNARRGGIPRCEALCVGE